MDYLCHFHINSFTSYFKTFSIQRWCFFLYSNLSGILRSLPYNFTANIQEGKTTKAKSINKSKIFNGK